MHVIKVPGVNEAWAEGLELIRSEGQLEGSRYGDVLRVRYPVTTVYTNPIQRVLTDPLRDANPFFHLMEALWILEGREDVAFLAQFNPKMREFSDNGTTFHAAYGHRLRHHFGFDQITRAVVMLRDDPSSRRVVMSIWDPQRDMGQVRSKDIPCNDTIKLEINNGALDMIVFNRSNDMIWGAYGANAVHFSMLLEYLAMRLNVEIGTYTQISSNFHVYLSLWDKYKTHVAPPGIYADRLVSVVQMACRRGPDSFDQDLTTFFQAIDGGYRKEPSEVLDDCHFLTPFFEEVVVPMYLAWQYRKSGHKGRAYDNLDGVTADDWGDTAREWMERRDR